MNAKENPANKTLHPTAISVLFEFELAFRRG